MNICTICNKIFRTDKALHGHSRVHSGNQALSSVNNRVCCIHTRKEMHIRFLDVYASSLRKCKQCGFIFTKKGLFCSRSCSATWNNSNRNHSLASKVKASETLKKFHAELPKFSKINFRTCKTCSKNFYTKSWSNHKKTCSKFCEYNLSSRRMSEKVSTIGTNFSTRVFGFSYKHIGPIDLDSKLEAAAIIYLVDKMNACVIQRCTSILNFKDKNGFNHRYNPDYYVKTDNFHYIVEVKQTYSQSLQINNYNRFFEEKKAALNEFALIKGLIPLWLDFDNAVGFKEIYRAFLKYGIR